MADILGIGLGAGVQAGLGALNNFFGAEAAAEARRENYRYNEMAADNADRRTRSLFYDLYSPSAQLRQLEAAGMSPSVFYQGTGSQGTSGAQGQGTAGQSTPYMPISMIEGAQMAKTLAETKNIEANTRTLEGENERGIAEIANLWANKGNVEASTSLNNIMTQLNNWDLEFKEDNLQFFASNLRKQNELLDEQIKNYEEATKGQSISNEINEDTKEIQKQQFSVTMANVIADTYFKYCQAELAQSNIKLNSAQMKYLEASIALKAEELSIRARELDFKYDQLNTEIDKFNSEMEFEIQRFNKNYQLERKKIGLEAGKTGMHTCTEIIKSILNLGGRIF